MDKKKALDVVSAHENQMQELKAKVAPELAPKAIGLAALSLMRTSEAITPESLARIIDGNTSEDETIRLAALNMIKPYLS